MAETQSDLLSYEIQKFSTDNLVELFQLDATILGGSTYYFTSTAYSDDLIYHNGIAYAPIDLEATGFEYSGQGSFPRPKVRVSNANLGFNSAVITYGDLVGSTFTRLRTFKQFLDDGDNADPTVLFPLDIYKVERKVTHNKLFIEWELSASIDQEGRQLPGRQFLKNACTHRYRVPDSNNAGQFVYTSATCPYTGTLMFNNLGETVTNYLEDNCGRRLTDCRKRFIYTQLPFRGFPGIGES